MAVALSEIVKNWNEIISFKIKVAYLTKPDEEFLTNALLSYLEKLNCDVQPLFILRYSESYETRSRFKLGLRQTINDIYKRVACASPDDEFYYIDLIKPTSKKTVEVLRYLLNYLFFHNQLQNEIRMESKIAERNNKLKNKQKLQTDIEKQACKAENIVTRIKEYQEALPKLKEKLDFFKEKSISLKKSITTLESSQDEFDLSLIQLKQQQNTVMDKILPDEEINKILNKEVSLENAMQEAREITETETKKKNDLDSKIDNLSADLNKITEITNVLPSEDSFKSLKSLVTQCRDMPGKLAYQIAQNKQIEDLISKKESLLHEIQIRIDANEEKRINDKSDFEIKTKELDKKINSLKSLNQRLLENLDNVEKIIAQQVRVKDNVAKAEEVLVCNLSHIANFNFDFNLNLIA